MHQVEVDIVYTQGLERGVDSLLDAAMPGVVELGGDPDLLARNPRVPNTLAYLRLVAICKSTVDSPFSSPEAKHMLQEALTCRCGGIPRAVHS